MPIQPKAGFLSLAIKYITRELATAPAKLMKKAVAPRVTRVNNARTKATYSTMGRGQVSTARRTAILPSPSFIPGSTKGRSGIKLSSMDSTTATADRSAVRATRMSFPLTLTLLITSPHNAVNVRRVASSDRDGYSRRQAGGGFVGLNKPRMNA